MSAKPDQNHRPVTAAFIREIEKEEQRRQLDAGSVRRAIGLAFIVAPKEPHFVRATDVYAHVAQEL